MAIFDYFLRNYFLIIYFCVKIYYYKFIHFIVLVRYLHGRISVARKCCATYSYIRTASAKKKINFFLQKHILLSKIQTYFSIIPIYFFKFDHRSYEHWPLGSQWWMMMIDEMSKSFFFVKLCSFFVMFFLSPLSFGLMRWAKVFFVFFHLHSATRPPRASAWWADGRPCRCRPSAAQCHPPGFGARRPQTAVWRPARARWPQSRSCPGRRWSPCAGSCRKNWKIQREIQTKIFILPSDQRFSFFYNTSKKSVNKHKNSLTHFTHQKCAKKKNTHTKIALCKKSI